MAGLSPIQVRCIVRLNQLLLKHNTHAQLHVQYSLKGTLRLKEVDPVVWLRYVSGSIHDWPVYRLHALLQW